MDSKTLPLLGALSQRIHFDEALLTTRRRADTVTQCHST
jgi:hypothetical protein